MFPETIIYENWPIYTWTSSFLIIASFFSLEKFQKRKDSFFLGIFFILQITLVLSRSAFHPAYLVLLFIIILLILKGQRVSVLKAFLLPFFLLVVVCFKNYFIFGFFGVGSGLGFSMYKVVPKVVNDISVVNQLKLHPDFKTVPVKAISKYGYSKENIPEKFKGIKILTDEYKTTFGKYSEEFSVNLGNFHYLEIAKNYQKSATKVIINYPFEYLKRVSNQRI